MVRSGVDRDLWYLGVEVVRGEMQHKKQFIKAHLK